MMCEKHNRWYRVGEKCAFCVKEEKEQRELEWAVHQAEYENSQPKYCGMVKMNINHSATNTDTQIFGMQPKHANTCYICGADLASDIRFQQYHMEKVHRLKC